MDAPSANIQLSDVLLTGDQPSPDCHEQMQLFDFTFDLDTARTELPDDQTSPKARHASYDSTSSLSSPILEEICSSLELPISSDSDPVLELDDVDLEEMSALLSDSDFDELLSPDSRSTSSSNESAVEASSEQLDAVVTMFSDAVESPSNVLHATPTLFGSGTEVNNDLSLQNILSWCPPLPLQTIDFNHISSTTNTRKRAPSSQDDKDLTSQDIEVILKKQKMLDDKATLRRIKNNESSKVYRSSKKQRRDRMQLREKELEEENSKLKLEIESMQKEVDLMRDLVIARLAGVSATK